MADTEQEVVAAEKENEQEIAPPLISKGKLVIARAP